MNLIWTALKEVIWAFSPVRSFYESMMKFDFKIEPPRQTLMQLCFSQLASWPLCIGFLLIYFDPFLGSISLQQILQKFLGSENLISFYLLDGHSQNMLVFLIGFFVLEWIVRHEQVLLFIVLWFVKRSDLHFHLGLAALLGIYLSRSCYLWWFAVDLQSVTKHIWSRVTSILLMSWIVTSVVSLYLLQLLHLNHFFSASVVENRFEFLVFIWVIWTIFSHASLSLWGHFYFKKEKEPTDLPQYYSTASWILRFKMSFSMKKKMREQVAEAMKRHQELLQQSQQLTDISPGFQTNGLMKVLQAEVNHLQMASSRLTVD